MKTIVRISFILVAVHFTLATKPLLAQHHTIQLIDHVEWPKDRSDPGDSACYVEFRESWTFSTRGTLSKEVQSYKFSCSGESIPPADGITRITDINYEFMLLDPHAIETGNTGFSEPDSMDAPTRKLQTCLIELAQKYIRFDKDYNPEEQLLSIYFHEEWEVNPEKEVIRKKVRAITPVIWQRRQTAEGQGINDADTGLPVYYKNPLHRIQLRQP